MADDTPRTAPLRPVDHVLANALAALQMIIVEDTGREAMLRNILDEALKAEEPENTYIQYLREAAKDVLTACGENSTMRAHHKAARALQEFFEWRLGQAQQRLTGWHME